jgi:hypothetical protein
MVVDSKLWSIIVLNCKNPAIFAFAG